MADFNLTDKQRQKARDLWYTFFDVFNLGTFTDEKKARALLKDLQKFFKDIGYENGVWCVEAVLVMGDKATDWDYDGLKGLLHTFVESFAPSKRELLELGGEAFKLKLQQAGIDPDRYFSK